MAQEQTTSEFEEPIPKRDDVTKLKRLAALKHMTHEFMMLDKINKQNKLVMDLAVQERDGTLGTAGQLEAFPEGDEGEAMGVNVGNEYHAHYPAPQAAPVPVIVESAKPESSIAKTIGTALIGAALPIAGAGGLAVYNYFTDNPATVEATDIHADIKVFDTPQGK